MLKKLFNKEMLLAAQLTLFIAGSVSGAPRSTVQPAPDCKISPAHSMARETESASSCSGPVGPISYKRMGNIFAPRHKKALLRPEKTNDRGLLGGTSTNCGSTMEAISSTAFIATGFVSFIPVAGPVLAAGTNSAGVITAIGGSNASSSCIEGQFAEINAQLAAQANSIQLIEDDMELAANAFYQEAYVAALQDASTSAYLYETDLNALSPSVEAGLGLYGDFMEDQTGFWSGFGMTDASVTPTSVATSPSFYDVQSWVSSKAPDFQSKLASVSAVDAVWVNDTTMTFCTSDSDSNCYVYATTNNGSSLIKLFKSMAIQLEASVNLNLPNDSSQHSDVVSLYEDYNLSLVSLYQRSAIALQQAFQMEWLVNQINYEHAFATNSDFEQIKSLGDIGGTLYTYKSLPNAQEQKAYNEAQLQLTLAYAARYNLLYINTINYVVSDAPVAGLQPQYPDQPANFTYNGVTYAETEQIDFANQVGAALPNVTGGPKKHPLDEVPAVATTALQNDSGAKNTGYILYQFSGLTDVAQCIKNIESYNQSATSALTLQEYSASNSCPSIFTDSNGAPLNAGFYDGNTLQPYYYTSGTPSGWELMGKMSNNLKFCDRDNPELTLYDPTLQFTGNAAQLVYGTTYLTCGNWATPQPSYSFPQANKPGWQEGPGPTAYYGFSNHSQFDENGVSWMETGEHLNVADCGKNAKHDGNAYNFILTLNQGPYNSGSGDERQCVDFIANYNRQWSSVSGVPGWQVTDPPIPDYTPNFIGGKGTVSVFNDVRYVDSWPTGCSLGFPVDFNRGGTYNDGPGPAAMIGLRLPNYAVGKEDGGFTIPVMIAAYCEAIFNNLGSYTGNYSDATFYVFEGSMDNYGWVRDGGGKFTTLDGSRYSIGLERYANGSAVLSVSQP